MRLVRLIYFSSISESTSAEDVLKILKIAQIRNSEVGITGALLLSNGYFVQALEGSRQAVSNTFCKLSRDSRHKNIHLSSFEEIDRREFHDWAMSLLSVKEIPQELFFPYLSNPGSFDPGAMNQSSLFALMKEISKLDFPGRL